MTAADHDLFTFLPEVIEARQAAADRKAMWSQPVACPSCGTVEPSGYQLQSNHGYSPEDLGLIYGFPAGQHPAYGRLCIAQYLVRNHIRYGVRHPEEDRAWFDARCARGRELGLDVDAIVAEAMEARA